MLKSAASLLILSLVSCAEGTDLSENTSVARVVENEAQPLPPRAANVAKPATIAPAAALEQSIPEAIRGVWRESEGNSVTAAECDLGSYENATRTLTIRGDRFSQFETGGRLLDVAERSDSRIRATFDTTYADEPTQGDYVFALEDEGRTLMVEEMADGGRGPVRHRRCPS